MKKPLFDDICGCGKPARYFIQGSAGACNKRMRCLTYEQQAARIQELYGQLMELQEFRNTCIEIGKTFEKSQVKEFAELNKCIPISKDIINMLHSGSGDNVAGTVISGIESCFIG